MKGKVNKNVSKKQNYRGPKGGKRPQRVKVSEDQELGYSSTEHKYNDVSWYAKNEHMLRDAASFSYNTPLGQIIDYDFQKNGGGAIFQSTEKSVPGLYTLGFVPTIGISTDSTSPANLAAQNIYSYVRYMNSGAKNYDQADLMLYLLAMDSVYMAWNWAKRIYAYARLYSQKNQYMPEMFARGDGVKLQSVVENLADYRLQLNSLAAQISSFCVPAVMPLFVRHSWMVSNIYKDSDNDKAQMYMFRPSRYYIYDETGSKYGGQLLAKPLSPNSQELTGALTADEIIDRVKTAIDALAYSEDIGVMSGDILKAYGQDKLFKLTPVMPDYEIIPVYNEEVLNQIHNSTVVDDTGGTAVDVTQDPDTGYLVWNPQFKTAQTYPVRALINMPWNEVTPANTMVGTRLTAMLTWDGATGAAVGVTMGTEYINSRTVWYYKYHTGKPKTLEYQGFGECLIFPTDAATLQKVVFTTSLVSNFDWHPLMPMFQLSNTPNPNTYEFEGYMGDMTNYTLVERWNMQQMHTTAILSEFNVPQIGSY